MERLARSFVTTLAALALFSGAAACKDAGAEAQITIPVEGMDCTRCAGKLAEGLRSLAGVRSALVSFEKRQAVVTYDPAKVTRAQLAAKVREVGFTPK
jgi:mercuric ion binding protein